MNTGTGKARVDGRPYVGLRAFQRADSHKFFGREREAYEVATRWQANRLTIMHGPSGVGKTSLINAGVLPLLDPDATDALPVGRVSHGSAFPAAGSARDPAAALPPQHNPHVFALLSTWAPHESPTRLARLTLASFLRGRPPRQDAFGDPVLVLLVIDQAEELFDDFAHRQPYREWFLEQLRAALRADENIRLLLCIRDDHLASIMPYRSMLVGHSHSRFCLDPLAREEARQAIEGPLAGTGRSFTPPALRKLLNDLCVEPGGPLPEQAQAEPVQLQVACSMLWRSLPAGVTKITQVHVGDVAAADEQVTDFCEEMVREVATEHLNGDLPRLTGWLARTFVTELVTRQRVDMGETVTAGMDNALVQALVDRDILHADRGGWCELSHDRLIHPILKAAGPIDLSREVRDPDDFLRAAELALRDRDLALAENLAGEALQRVAGDIRLEAEIRTFLGNVAYQAEGYDTAIERYRDAARLFEMLGAIDAVGRLLVGIGRLRLAQGRPGEAVNELAAAMRRLPHDRSVKIALAWALWHDGAPQMARDILTDVLEQEGGSLDALQARGEILAGMGLSAAALRDLNRAGPLQWPSTKAAHALAATRLAAHEPTETAQEIDKEIMEALADAPDSGPVQLYAAWISAAAGNREAAVAHAERALSAHTPSLPGHLVPAARRLTSAA
ncbi:hypothetical protein Acor_35310 [Acrocarpospora corrugata]|uniref:Novel STAND NTPase 1 domain-containing protein n=1 Tax=Acrocarpospora corrugata TaxID=35763 RepID=A0A5M3VX76_9ACTN|nr:tetratricopeptide repeat protein [Acrocarpospora corrugata]GES01467.1 hypothetical protein Acor_35310 [Acrocarpospora corrugata]